MSVESDEKLLAPPGICAEQDCNVGISLTPTITPQIHPIAYRDRKRPSTIVLVLCDWWYMELLCMVLSFATFGFYCWFLHYNDGQPDNPKYLFDIWVFGNMGAAIAQIAVVLKLLMFVPVSSALGQLSWYRFLNATSKPVADLQTYDAASRGFSGSVRFLLSRNPFRSPHATLGAVLTIASVYLASAMQNAIHHGEESWRSPVTQHDGKASIPFVDSIDHRPPFGTVIVDENNDEIDTRMGSAIYSAWLYNTNLQESNVPVSFLPVDCWGSDADVCQWERYTTIAAKSVCRMAPARNDPDGFGYSSQANINSSVRALGNHSASSIASARLKFETSLEIPKTSSFTTSFPDKSAVIIYLAAIADGGLSDVVAAECILNWQVQHISKLRLSRYTASTDNPLERAESKWYNTTRTRHPGIDNETIFEAPCNPNYGNTSCEYKIKRAATQQLQEHLEELFPGYVLPDSQNSTLFRVSGNAIDVFARSWIDRKGVNAQTSLTETLEKYMSNVAKGISGYILSTATKTSVGQIGSLRSCRIAWYHITYPLAMVVLSAYLLLFTMWWTRRMPVWKTSLLPFLYHGLQHPPCEQRDDLSSLGSMRQMSSYQTVVLRDEDDGLGLKLRDTRVGIASKD